MNNQLQVFKNEQFGKIRMIEINDKPYFVAIDIAKALGYKDTTNAIKQHCRWVVKHKVPHPQSKNKTLEVNVIPEGDMYRLITNSELPSAEKFESWVFDEVLPQIRKTGSYQIPKMSKELQAIFMIDGKTEELKNEINGVKKDLEDFKDNAPLFNSECDELMDRVKSVATKILGYKTPAYNDKSLRGRVYSDMQHQLRREFGVKKYKAIKRCQLSKAFEIVNNYVAPTVLIDEITRVNNQVSFEEAM